jgi:NAD(P)-dependent dehydrogenase (short-subunit alcohol dehydrogenase family)
MTISFSGQVAIVTGAGQGLGRSHAIELARRGAKVVVNDLAAPGQTHSESAAEVVELITREGGEAFAHGANVANTEDVADMVKQTMDRWGRIDILINNAGILRDKTFSKMEIEDFRLVLDVHVMGSVICTKAVWDIMRDQNYGRILLTTSSSGLYGMFGQSNYGTAKTAMLGLMNCLVLEGEKNGIRVNAISPVAGTQMTADLMPEEIFKKLTVESVTAGALTLCHKDAPNRMVLCAGGGGYARAQIFETQGMYLPEVEQTPESLTENWQTICDEEQQVAIQVGYGQIEKFMQKAQAYIKQQG